MTCNSSVLLLMAAHTVLQDLRVATTRVVVIALLTVVSSTAGTQADAQSPADLNPFDKCIALASVDFTGIADAPTQIIDAKIVEPSDTTTAYCRVEGYVAPNIGFELRLPTTWNGKFIQVGSGGYGGTFEWIKWCPTQKGYACLVTDMGHKGTAGDGLWAYNNLQGKVDWGLQATHVAALAGKAVTQSYYSNPPAKSYFMGCSTGGRQALQEAQRFPWDFDGILAGSPPVDLSALYVNDVWFMRVLNAAGGPLFGREDLEFITHAALTKCGLGDGVRDGVIGDPTHCGFDPGELACRPGQESHCLNPAQVTALRKVYSGPMDSNGKKLTVGGILPGAEYNLHYFLRMQEQPIAVEGVIRDGFRYLFFWPEPGPTWQVSAFDFDRDYKRMGSMQALVDSSNPDLRKFKVAGGKLLAYMGMNDSYPRQVMDYYETVERTIGGRKATQEFFRLFMLPGVDHCSGGVGADAVDFLGYLEAWVEHGRAPQRILSGHLRRDSPPFSYPYRPFPARDGELAFTRPVYPYPTRVKYKGTGDPNDAANFVPVD